MKTHLLALLSLFCIGTALAQTPRDERIARAVERMDDGDYDEAARLLESVLAADPKNFLANYETGYLLYLQERYEEAVEVLRRIKRRCAERANAGNMKAVFFDKSAKRESCFLNGKNNYNILQLHHLKKKLALCRKGKPPRDIYIYKHTY